MIDRTAGGRGLEKPFDLEGEWWLPSEPTRKVFGVLSYEPDAGASLRLRGTLGTTTVRTPRPEIILGTTDHEGACTIHRCIASQWSDVLHGPSRLVANAVLVGAHFESASDLLFDRFAVRLSDLEAWTKVIPFEPPTRDDSSVPPTWTLRFKPPEAIEVDADSTGGKLAIRFSADEHLSPFGAGIYLAAILELIPSAPVSLESAEQRIIRLRRLFSLLIGRPVTLRWIMLAKTTSEVWLFVGGNRRRAETYPHGMLRTLPQVRPILGHVVKTWFDSYAAYAHFFDAVISQMERENVLVEERYMSVVNALDAFHRAKPPPKGKWRLHERLLDLIGEWRIADFAAVITRSDPDWATKVTNTRNNPSHGINETPAFDLNDTIDATFRLEALASGLALRHLGVSETDAIHAIATSERFSFLWSR